MFTGTYRHQIDDKGRFRIPVPLRKGLGDNPMMIVGFEDCIMIYPQEDYERIVNERFKSEDILNTEVSKIMRLIYSRSQAVEMDSQGRILLNSELADRVGIKKNLVTMGVGNRVEVWAEEVLEGEHDIEAEAKEAFKTVAQTNK